MDAVSYPDPQVQQYLQQYFIPVQFNVVEQPEAMAQFHTPWTPTLIFQDADGVEHRRSQGFLDASRLLGELSLARLKDAIDRRDFQEAFRRSDETLQWTRGDREREPEAMYWSGVAQYKAKNEGLMERWNQMIDQFPDSEWAKKASFIRS